MTALRRLVEAFLVSLAFFWFLWTIHHLLDALDYPPVYRPRYICQETL